MSSTNRWKKATPSCSRLMQCGGRPVRIISWSFPHDESIASTARHGVADHYTFVAGDLHETDFGQGHVIAILGHILHSEGEVRSRQLLRKTFDALAPGGTIAIAEILVDT